MNKGAAGQFGMDEYPCSQRMNDTEQTDPLYLLNGAGEGSYFGRWPAIAAVAQQLRGHWPMMAFQPASAGQNSGAGDTLRANTRQGRFISRGSITSVIDVTLSQPTLISSSRGRAQVRRCR